jgi:hypothetical protein
VLGTWVTSLPFCLSKFPFETLGARLCLYSLVHLFLALISSRHCSTLIFDQSFSTILRSLWIILEKLRKTYSISTLPFNVFPHRLDLPRNSSSMSYFPEISSLDFSLRRANGKIVQGPVDAPEFEFQFTSNFDFYRPCSTDFIWLDPPVNMHATLRSDLASCYWETLKMKCRYILAAAHGWKGDFDKDPLPQVIPSTLLSEIGMIHPPFPPLDQLTYNFFLLPEDPAEICRHVKIWQENSRQLSAWIEKAKGKCAKVQNCSWSWPTTPFAPYPVGDDSSSVSEDDGWMPNHRESDKTFVESPSPSSESLTPHTCFSSDLSAPDCAAHAFNVEAQSDSSKRVRNPSPADSHRDGNESNKKQLVLWQPSVAQLLERYEALMRGEVSSHSSLHADPEPYSPCNSSLTVVPITTDPRLPVVSTRRSRALPTSRVTRSQTQKK